MMKSAKMVVAGLREEGTVCRRCQKEINSGDHTTACPDCGGIHHWECWLDDKGCAAYECSSGNRSLENQIDGYSGPVLRVSGDDLANAAPLNSTAAVAAGWAPAATRKIAAGPKRWNKLAIAALVFAILGIPLFGIVTGLIAVVVGCLALAGHSNQWKGAAMAVAGIVLGIVDVAGWTVGMLMVFDAPALHVTSISQFDPDPKALEELPSTINRAMKSNVLIETSSGLSVFRGSGLGSGVIVRIKDGLAWIITNRHVVDPNFATDSGDSSNVASSGARMTVKAIGQPVTPGQLIWIAPHGIDLAMITTPLTSKEAKFAVWDAEPKTTVGSEAFAIGNPHGLGWTYTPGGISQLRRQTKGPLEVRVIQTSAAINPGNSGGGLYDRDGRLIGINTWTKDKRFAEGLSFAIAFHTLLPLLPADHKLPDHQLEADQP